jgi:hypothetical protein
MIQQLQQAIAKLEQHLEFAEEIAIIKQYIDSTERIRTALQAADPNPKTHYFICGEKGDKVNGLPRYIDVCPHYGATTWTRYAKTHLEGLLEW